MKTYLPGLLLLAALCFSFIPVSVHAQTGLVPCQLSNPTQANPLPKCTVMHLFGLAVRIYNFLLGLMAFIAVLILVISGIRLFLYQYDEKPEAELEAIKLTIRRALFGIVLIICGYLIVYTLLLILGVRDGAIGNENNPTLRYFLRRFGFNI